MARGERSAPATLPRSELRAPTILFFLLGVALPAAWLSASCGHLVSDLWGFGTWFIVGTFVHLGVLAAWLFTARKSGRVAAFYAAALIGGSIACALFSIPSYFMGSMEWHSLNRPWPPMRTVPPYTWNHVIAHFAPIALVIGAAWNGILAKRRANWLIHTDLQWGPLVLGLLVPPLLIVLLAIGCFHFEGACIDKIVDGDDQERQAGLDGLHLLWPVVIPIPLARAAKIETKHDLDQARRLEQAYREITGEGLPYFADLDW